MEGQGSGAMEIKVSTSSGSARAELPRGIGALAGGTAGATVAIQLVQVDSTVIVVWAACNSGVG